MFFRKVKVKVKKPRKSDRPDYDKEHTSYVNACAHPRQHEGPSVNEGTFKRNGVVARLSTKASSS